MIHDMNTMTATRILAGQLQPGDIVAEDDPSMAFPDDYDLPMCEWAEVLRIVTRHADTIEFELAGVGLVHGSTEQTLIRQIREQRGY